MPRCKRVLFACVSALGLAVAGAAHAQFLDLDVTTSRGAYAAGRPQVFTSTAPTKADGTPTVFGGAGVTLYSLTGVFSNGAPANGVALPASTPIGVILANNPNAFLVRPEPARSGELHTRLGSLLGAEDIDTSKVDGIGFGTCKANSTFNDNVGLPAGTTVDSCDTINATARMNGVTFRLTGGENQVPLRLEIPELGYAFTSNAVGTPASPFANRADSLRNIRDNLYDSGKAQLLAARLLGKPDDYVLRPGVLPNEGNLLTGSITAGGATKSFAVDNPGQLLAYVIANRHSSFSDFGINYIDDCSRVGGVVNGTCGPLDATARILGVKVSASAPAQSTDITFSAPDLDLNFTSSNAADRNAAARAFADYARDNVDGEDLTRAYARYLAQTNPSDPLVGNPYSAQGQLTRLGLDLDTPSSALNETDGKRAANRTRVDDPAGWMVGGRTGYLSTSGQGAEFVDAVFERGFRIREGSRARLKISVPASYIHYESTGAGRHDSSDTATFGLRASLEAPLIDGKWVVEPSAAASAFYSSNVVSSGALYSVGLSSRYKIAPIGRGHIVIGNAVNYSSTLEIEAGNFASPKISNTAVRNGIAYQVPYGRFLGRQGTARASYTYTHLFGDKVLVDDYHEVTLSYGVASREASVKQVGETLRFGLNGAFGHRFTAVSLTAGYRF